MRLFLLMILMLGFVSLFSGCADDTATTASSSSTGAEAVNTNLTTVQNGMVPDSLAYSTSSLRMLRSGSNPCAAVENAGGEEASGMEVIFACQPILLRLYMNTVKEMIGGVINIIASIKTNIDGATDGETSTFTEGNLSYVVNKTTINEWTVTGSNSGNAYMYADISPSSTDSSSTYTIKLDFSTAPSDFAQDSDSGQFSAVVVYTDENNFSATLNTAGQACSSSDVAAPDMMNIYVSRANDLWTGGVVLRSPRWWNTSDPSQQLTCESSIVAGTADTPGTEIFMVTRFAANETAGKAEVSLMPRSVTEITDSTMETYELKNFLSIFQISSCGPNNASCPDLSGYIDPFCSEISTNTSIPTAHWNNTCGSYSDAIANATLNSTNLIPPSTFYNYSITIE